jgi:RHS repeat-associated protein
MLHFNVGNGGVCCSAVDFALPGFIPFDFERNYKSSLNHCGYLGWNWTTPLDSALLLTPSGFSFRDQWGHTHALEAEKKVPPEERLFQLADSGRDLVVTTPENLRWRFFDSGEGFLPHRIEDESENAIKFEYGSNGLIQLLTDTLGRRVAIRHDGRRIAEFQFLSRTGEGRGESLVRYAYDRSDNLTAVWDANGNACRFEYDGHLIVRYENRIGGSQYVAYDQQGRCVHLWWAGGERARWVRYDDRRRTTAVTDSRGASTIYRWNEAGIVTEEVNVFGVTTSSILDDANASIASLDERGNPKLTTVYDEETRTLAVTDAAGATTLFKHDDRGRVTREVDACGEIWQYFYDELGRVQRVVRPSGAESSLDYDTRGFVRSRRDTAGNILTQNCTADGTRFSLVDSLGLMLEYRYDELGRFIGWADALGERSSLRRDAAGRVLTCFWPDESRVQYSYDAEGNLVTVVDELGNQTAFSFDPSGKCRQATNPLGDSIRFQYDREWEITEVTDERGKSWRFEYDLLGRVIRQIFLDDYEESYAYDERGDLVQITQGDGTSIRLSYSPVGRIICKTYSDGTSEYFSYDALRRMISASNAESTVCLKWDKDGRLIQQKQGEYTLEHAYDAAGNLALTENSTGRTISYRYDPRGNLISIADSITGEHEFEYDVAGRLRRRLLPNGAQLDFDYDARRRVVSQRLHTPRDLQATASCRFDLASRPVEQRTIGGTSERILYDACGRVLDVSSTGRQPELYSYDPTGNVIRLPGLGDLTYAEGDRLTQVADESFVYDARGALTGSAQGASRMQFVHDVAGRLTKLLRDGSTLASYNYDPLGRRVSKTVDGSTTAFRWDGFVLLGECGPGGDADYLFEPRKFLPLSRMTSGKVEHFVTDSRGCVTGVLDESAGLTATFQFDAFGALRSSTLNEAAPPFRLRGQYFDSESGLHYNLQRYYQPANGRFLTRDPLGIAAGLNPYLYGPNTFTWVDPFGLSSECQGDVFYRAMSTKEKEKVLADCQLHAKKSKCPEGPYVTQSKAYCQKAIRKNPSDYEHLAEICTQPGTVQTLLNSPYAGINSSQAMHWPTPMPAIASGQVNRIELKFEKVPPDDMALNYGLSSGEGLKTFNSKIESIKFTPSGESCAK